MSGFPAGTGSTANGGGLDSLFAQLRQQQNRPINLEPSNNYYNNTNNNNFGQPSQHRSPHGYEQPSVSSPIATPPVHTQPPHHNSAIMSPISDSPQPRIPPAIGGASNADRTSSLLNLLKFSQPSASSASQPAPIGTPALPVSRDTSASYNAAPEMLSSSYGRASSSQDLLAALMSTSQPKPHASPQFTAAPQATASTFSASPNSPPADTQAYLLRLLNQPKPPQSDVQPQLEPAQESISPKDSTSQGEVEELVQALEDASLDMDSMGAAATEGKLEILEKREVPSAQESSPAPKVPQGIFTYVNPFDQLAASSPRNRTPKPTTPTPKPSSSGTPAFQILKRQVGEGADNKRKNDERSNVSSPAHSKRKLETTSDVSSAPPTPLADGRSPLEAMIGIGAPQKETVAEAVSELGGQVNKQVEQAIAEAEQGESQAAIEKGMDNLMLAETEEEFEGAAQAAASAIKKELDKEENSGALDDLPTPLAEAVKDIIDETAHGHIADSWESADAEDGPESDEVRSPVKVFNFPMRPFITITVNASEDPGPFFRSEAVIDIARLKKEFDQIDRTLVTATSKFIVYAMSKNGGIRIIRQEDGKDSKLFTDTKERIFNVATSTGDMKETIIGTGINGTVYWATIKDGEGDYIEDSHPETHGFALPPLQTHEQESPGGVLKTRARKSSTHPDFFAVGRGKSIHIIWPSIIMKQAYLKDGKERIVDTEKYLSHRSLKVNTGKAGKDFTFSEDDTTIASLDKAGRVKFWDVRSLTKTTADMRFPSPEQIEPIEIKEPLLTFITTPATEKSWPTSVLFVDKLRPYQRGGALRYLIVGMKQNHTLQLWDLGLSKPVQEIHLPHTKESDAMCSVLYHAASGMIIVGHPTRNSIYFFHLSAPKYSLPRSLTQAEYIEKLVANDPSIPKPDSTAVLSGMREYSLANKGNLRSLDILQNPETVPAGEDPTLFELYAMHSKGVTCLSLKQLDMGWSLDNKVIEPFAAEKCDAIAITALKDILLALPEKDLPHSVPQSPAPAHRIIQRPAGKENTKKIPTEATSGVPPKAEEKIEKKDFAPASNGQTAVGGTEKSEKKKRRKATQSSSGEAPAAPAQSSKNAQAEALSPVKNGPSAKTTSEAVTSVNLSEDVIEGSFKNIETRIAGQFKKVLGDSMDSLNRNIKEDRRTQAAVSEAKQDAMLRLVSTTLSENVEGTLGRIISTSIKQSVLPAITDVTSKAVNEQLGSKLNVSINNSLPKELQKLLPDAIAKTLQQPQLQKSMAESLAKSVTFRVEETFANLLQKTITPAFSTLAIQASQRVAADIQRQASEQIGSLERQRQADSLKIEQLTQVVSGLTEMVTTMAAAQSEFQGQFLKMQQQSTRDRDSSSRPETALVTPEKTREQLEQEEFDVMLESINVAMNEGNYEDAIIRWLQTGREQEFFANFFSKFNPAFIRELNPLMLLSVGATVSIELEGPLLMERVAWLEVILSALTAAISTMEDHVRELIPKIMSIYTQRLEHLFMRISNVAAQDPILKRLSLLVSASNRLLDSSTRSSMIPRAPSAASSARATPHILGSHRGSTSGRGLGL